MRRTRAVRRMVIVDQQRPTVDLALHAPAQHHAGGKQPIGLSQRRLHLVLDMKQPPVQLVGVTPERSLRIHPREHTGEDQARGEADEQRVDRADRHRHTAAEATALPRASMRRTARNTVSVP